MNAHIPDGMFDDIAHRILRAVDELRTAIADGSVADPIAARELADRMQRYADSVLVAQADPGRD
ncbi:hypothetical protein sos41_04660 [Alphaproteobacteria bacterium SO-S41]|nr:hypothetical protein sos41_04660 [Alphaproteobacteria bacterium SO-S41]